MCRTKKFALCALLSLRLMPVHTLCTQYLWSISSQPNYSYSSLSFYWHSVSVGVSNVTEHSVQTWPFYFFRFRERSTAKAFTFSRKSFSFDAMNLFLFRFDVLWFCFPQVSGKFDIGDDGALGNICIDGDGSDSEGSWLVGWEDCTA